MKDFIDDLDRRLQAIAAEQSAAPQPRRSRRRPALLSGAVALLAAIAGGLVLTSASVAELPILETATTDATAVRDQLPDAKRWGIDFTKAHPFSTPGGKGYALANRERGTLCVMLPDPETDGTFGTACGSLAKARRSGMTVQLVGDRTRNPHAVNTVAFVLPEDAEQVRLKEGNEIRTPQLTSGIVLAHLSEAATLSWVVDGVRRQRALRGPSESSGLMLDCGDGRVMTVPMPRVDGGAVGDAIRALRRKHC